MNDSAGTTTQELLHKGFAAVRKKNYAYAVELFQMARDSGADTPECLHGLWTALREKHTATPATLPALLREKIIYAVLTLRLLLTRARNNTAAMRPLLEARIVCSPHTIPAYRALAIFFLEEQQFVLARAAFEEILFIDNRYPPALLELCRLYFKEKNYVQAQTTARQLLAIDPRNLEADNILKDIAAMGTIAEGFDTLKPAT